jgi:hypothetical protein
MSPLEDSVMKGLVVALATIVMTIGTATAATSQTAITSDQSPFRFQFEQTTSPRGVGVEGYVYNPLPWRITNVRVQVDSVDAAGTVVASASGWVLGDVAAGGRGYFYVPVSSQAPTYRPSVQTFDKVMLEARPAPQAP